MAIKQFYYIVLIILNEVYSIQADCNVPDAVPNAQLESDLGIMNRFSENYSLGYVCDPGFFPVPSRYRECENGKWTHIDCIRITCKWLPDPEHGKRLDFNVFAGTRTHFECNDGYEIVGSTSLMCQSDGEWSPKEPPICKRKLVTCPDFDPPIHNGIVHHDDDNIHLVGHKARIECNESSTIFPKDFDGITVCEAQGKWSVNQISCEGQITVSPTDNMLIYKLSKNNRTGRLWGPKTLKSRTRLHVRCNTKHELYDGQAEVYMDMKSLDVQVVNGTLVPELPVCKEVNSCPDFDPPLYDGTIYHDDIHTHLIGHVAEIECDAGSDMFPEGFNGITFCEARDRWNVSSFSCERRLTVSPTNNMLLYKLSTNDMKELLLGPKTLRSRTRLHVRCNTKHELYDGQAEVYMDMKSLDVQVVNGTMVPELPVCKEERCYLVSNFCSYTDKNDNLLTGKVEHGTRVFKTCDSNFEFEDENIRTIISYSSPCNQGSLFFPSCILKRCEIPTDRQARIGREEYRSGDLVKSGQTVRITCEDSEELYYMESKTYVNVGVFMSSCKWGVWSSPFFPVCKKKRCLTPTRTSTRFLQGNIQVMSGTKLEDGTILRKLCVPGYENRHAVYTRCDSGVWWDNEPCTLKFIPETTTVTTTTENFDYDRHDERCVTPRHISTRFLQGQKGIMPGTKVEDGTILRKLCAYGYEIKHNAYTRCDRGVWRDNEPCTPEFIPETTTENFDYGGHHERCLTPRHIGTHFLRGNMEVKPGTKVEPGDTLRKWCAPGYENKHNAYIRCDSGVWLDNEPCTPKFIPETTTVQTTTENVDYDRHDERCVTPRHISTRFLQGQIRIMPGTKVEDGTTLRKLCAYGYENKHNAYIRCDRGVWRDNEPCTLKFIPETTTVTTTTENVDYGGYDDDDYLQYGYDYNDPDENGNGVECSAPANGRIVKGYFYTVLCDEGYTLNTIEGDTSYKCTGGKLLSYNYKREPTCTENPCLLTDEMLAEMRVFDRRQGVQQFYPDAREFKPDGRLFFNCDGANQEPANRLFRCSQGRWIAAERDPDWTMEIRSWEPSCRPAKCVPGCEFGGTCVRDGTCKCAPGSKGTNCETPICNRLCEINGGTCVGPSRCKCIEPRYGVNCETVGCTAPPIPEDVIFIRAYLKTSFRIGDILPRDQLSCPDGHQLSTFKDIVCTEGNIWSEQIKCVNETIYKLEVKIGSGKLSGSTGPLVITLRNDRGVSLSKMVFDPAPLRELLPGKTYTSTVSRPGYSSRVGEIKLVNAGNDNIEIDRIRLTVDHANSHDDYYFTGVGWLENSTPVYFHPDINNGRQAQPGEMKIYTMTVMASDGTINPVKVTIHGTKGTSDVLVFSNNGIRRSIVQRRSWTLSDVGEVTHINVTTREGQDNQIRVQYIYLKAKDGTYLFFYDGFMQGTSRIEGNKLFQPGCQGRTFMLVKSGFTTIGGFRAADTEESCKALCKDHCKVVEISGRPGRLGCKIVDTNNPLLFTFSENVKTNRLFFRKC